MGYYASGGGEIEFYQLTKAQREEIEGIIDWYEFDWWSDNKLNIWCSDKYNYETGEMLNAIASIAPVKDGIIEFYGEEDCHWRFLYDKETRSFCEDEGFVTYASEMKLKPSTLPEFIEELRGLFENPQNDEDFQRGIVQLLVKWEAMRLL